MFLAAAVFVGLQPTLLSAAEWEKLAVPDDLERMERMTGQRAELVEIAKRDGSPENLALVKGLVESKSQKSSPAALNGKWKCRSIGVGGLPPVVVYELFDCEIRSEKGKLRVAKTTGTTRMTGTLYEGPGDGLVFLGASHFDNERPVAYGTTAGSNMIGLLRVLDSKRLVLEMPSKGREYTMIEFVRGTPAPAARRTSKEIADNFMQSERCRGNANSPEQRIEACTQLLADPREHRYFPMHHHQRGQAYVGKKDYASAIKDFNDSIRLLPEGAHAYMDRGTVYWVMEGDSKTGEYLQKAKADLDKAIAHQPTLARAWFIRGMIKLDEKDFPGALSDLDRAILLDPDNRKAYVERAEAKRQLGDVKGSEEDITKSIALDSKRQEGNPKAPAVVAQRDKLDGFGDVKFGAPATAAKAALGAKAKVAAARGSDGSYVSSDIVHEGVAYTLNYYFTPQDKMVRIEFFPREGITNSKAQCMAATGKIVATFNRRFGNPDRDETKGEDREVEYNFKDGTQALIQSSFFDLGSLCILSGNYSVPEGRLTKN